MKLLFWVCFWSLLFLPMTNSFVVNLNLLVNTLLSHNQYKNSLSQLVVENNTLNNKLKYYMTESGFESLVKERLERLDEGEVLIKYLE